MPSTKAPPELPLSAYFGSYHDPGHGTWIVRPLASEAQKYGKIEGADAFYKRIDGEASENNRALTDELSLLVDIGERTFFSFIYTLVHAGENRWEGTETSLYEPCGSRKHTPIIYLTSNELRFDFHVEKGKVVGLAIHGVWGKPDDVEEAEDVVEVYLKKA
jgi:hypothetical protein